MNIIYIRYIIIYFSYKKSSRFRKLGYEKEFGRIYNINICRIFFNKFCLELFLKSLVADVDRRIKRGQERLRLTQGYLPEELPKVI